jgi:hypothetical protein
LVGLPFENGSIATDAASIQDGAAACFVTREVRKTSAKAIQARALPEGGIPSFFRVKSRGNGAAQPTDDAFLKICFELSD